MLYFIENIITAFRRTAFDIQIIIQIQLNNNNPIVNNKTISLKCKILLQNQQNFVGVKKELFFFLKFQFILLIIN